MLDNTSGDQIQRLAYDDEGNQIQYKVQHDTVTSSELTGLADSNIMRESADISAPHDRQIVGADKYIVANKYAEPAQDSDDEDNPKLKGRTPRTKKRIKRQEQSKEFKLLGPVATGFTLFKGFVCSGILYMPISFVNGGYGFSAIALIFALMLTLYCISLLLDTRQQLGGQLSFSDIGTACFGKTGKLMVDISLFASQTGFTCAYIYFIANQTMLIINAARDKHGLGIIPESIKWWFAPICFVILMPMVMVRKVQTFAKLHLFGDAMIAIALIVIVGYATASVT